MQIVTQENNNPFKKTRRKKTGGRQKGTPNKVTKELKEKLTAFINGNYNIFIDTLNEITDPVERAKLFIKLMEYVLPKQQKIDLEGDLEIAAVNVEFKKTGIAPIHEEADPEEEE